MSDFPDPLENMRSTCCNARIEPAHADPHEGQTNFFVCSECKKQCGIEYSFGDEEE